MKVHRIAVFNMNETRRDPRVLRVAHLLAELGHTVRVFEMVTSGQPEYDRVGEVEVQRVRVPTDYSRRAIAEIGRACPEAAQLLWSCEPAVLKHGPTRLTMPLQRVHLGLRRRWRGRRGTAANPSSQVDLTSQVAAIRSIMLVDLALYHAAGAFRPTMAYCNDLDTLLTGYMLKRRLGVGLIYDAHEIYPEQFPEQLRSDIWYRFYSALERQLIGHSDGRLTVCDSLGAYFAAEYSAQGFVTLRNVPSIRHLPPESTLARRQTPRQIIYHGAYFPFRGLEEVIAAAPMVDHAKFVFRGIGAHEAELRRLVAERGVEDRVTFAAPVAVHELVRAASVCDLGLNPFVDVCKNTSFALPNKFFEYMMAGLALASSDLVEMRELTLRWQLGVLFKTLQPRDIADTLNRLLAQPDQIDAYRATAYHLARTRFHWEQEREILIDAVGRFT